MKYERGLVREEQILRKEKSVMAAAGLDSCSVHVRKKRDERGADSAQGKVGDSGGRAGQQDSVHVRKKRGEGVADSAQGEVGDGSGRARQPDSLRVRNRHGDGGADSTQGLRGELRDEQTTRKKKKLVTAARCGRALESGRRRRLELEGNLTKSKINESPKLLPRVKEIQPL